MQAAAADAAKQAEVAARRAQLAQSLPPEPPADTPEATILAMFQLPDGSRHKRRFCLSAPVDTLFDFVESVGAGGWAPQGYNIVTRYPRRVLVRSGGDGGGSLTDARLSAGQELFMLEPADS